MALPFGSIGQLALGSLVSRGADRLLNPDKYNKDLIDRLSMLDDTKEIVFYNLDNDDLKGRELKEIKELETILDVDGHVEITIGEIDNV